MLFPIRDDVPAERKPVVNWLLIAINVLVFVYMVRVLPDASAQVQFIGRFGLVPGNVRLVLTHPQLALDVPWQVARDVMLPLFTAMFLHGSWAHLLGNMWFLLIFGDNVEGRLGHWKYLVFYFLCGLIAWSLHIASIPAEGVVQSGQGTFFIGRNPNLNMPAVGASGAIAGVLGAYTLFFPRARVTTFFVLPIFFFQVRAFLFLVLWFVMQFISARNSSLKIDVGGGIAYWAHVGGFLAGLLLALVARRRPPPPAPR